MIPVCLCLTSSLSITVSKSIHVAANDIILFFAAEYYPVVHMCHIFFSFVLAMANSASVNLRMRVSYHTTVFSRYMPRSGIAGSYSSSIFSFLSSVQSLSRVWLFATQHARTVAQEASLSVTNSQSLLKLMSIESVMPSNHLILCHPLFLLPSIFPSIRVFSNESILRLRWPKYWSFSFNISPSNEYSGLISFRMDWLDLLAIQGTLKSLLQHHVSKASVLQHSAFFMVQLSHPYVTTEKTIALNIQTSVSKVMSLLFNMLSRLVIAFLPRSKHLLISWLQSPSAVILESKKIKSVTVSIVSPSICHEVKGPVAMILVFWILSFKPALSLSSFTFIKRLFNSSSLSPIRVVSSVYLRLLIFLPPVLIPACASSSLAFYMMYSAYKLNKQGDNIQPWRTLSWFGTSVVPCPVVTVASWPACRFLRRQVRWSASPTVCCDPHTFKGFSVVNEAEVDVFLEFFCFLSDLTDIGNLISFSSAFSKSKLNIWKFSVHALLKPSLENVEHYFASLWEEYNCAVVWTFFGIAFLWDWDEKEPAYCPP